MLITVHNANSLQIVENTSDNRMLWKRRQSVASMAGLVLTPMTSWAASEKEAKNTLRSRLQETTLLVQQPPSPRKILQTPTTYPSWMESTWDVTQTLTECYAPLGIRFLGGPNGDESIGAASWSEVQSRRNEPVRLALRYIRSQDYGDLVVEDRVFNTQSRLDAFAGRRVVSSVTPTRDTATGQSDGALLVQFRGPAAQKTFVTAHHPRVDEDDASSFQEHWYGFECQRSLFALTNANTAPPVSTDTELLFCYQRTNENLIEGKLRIASYLNPIDRLYFDAQRRAVSLQDYALRLERRVGAETS